MSYDYKKTSCSLCHQDRECVSVWSNITPWLCEGCCRDEGEFWTREEEEEFDDE